MEMIELKNNERQLSDSLAEAVKDMWDCKYEPDKLLCIKERILAKHRQRRGEA